MSPNPFSFLLDLPDTDARYWLSRYILDESTTPTIQVPFDLQRLEFLLGEVNPLPDPTLPLRIGDLAGGLLAETLLRGGQRTHGTRFLTALFTLLESLPVSEPIEEFLNDLVISGRLLDRPAGSVPDFHLLALRVLVLHQRPVSNDTGRLVDLWRREARQLRYASIAIQGMLRASPAAAVDALPDFIERALAERPPLPLANLLFAFSVELDSDKRMWKRLVSAFAYHPEAFEAVRQTLRKTSIPRSQPVAWEVLQAVGRSPAKQQSTESLLFVSGGLFPLSVEQHPSLDPESPYWGQYREDFAPQSQDELVLSVTSRQMEYRASARGN